jgi:hypothetical protein
MSNRLTRWQAAFLGLLVAVTLGLSSLSLVALAAKERLWAETYDLALSLPDASDVPPGTPVRIRGVEAGHVLRIDYPSDDSSDAVLVQLRLDAQYRGRLFNDATVRIQPVGLLGSKAVAISPGTPAAGVLSSNVLTAQPSPDFAAEASRLLKDARAAAGRIEQEASKVNALVADGRETLRSVRQSTDAVQRMPLIRNYVENADALLVRPDCRHEKFTYNPRDLFEPGTAILHDAGRQHLANLAELLKSQFAKAKLEIVVAALADPNDTTLTSGGAYELTRKQAEAVIAALKADGAHKTSFFSKNHPLTPLGLGTGPSPVVEADALPARVQVFAFTPP